MREAEEAVVAIRILRSIDSSLGAELTERATLSAKGYLRYGQRERGYDDCLRRFRSIITNTISLIEAAVQQEQQ